MVEELYNIGALGMAFGIFEVTVCEYDAVGCAKLCM